MRCGHLESWGKQCRKKATNRYHYHGDSEVEYVYYDDRDTTWVVVPLCKFHGQHHKEYKASEYRRKQ